MRALVVALGLMACGPAAEGPKGDKGDKGDPGAQGSAGPPGSTQGQQIVEVVGTGQLAVTAATNYSVIPGLTTTVSVPANARVHVQTDGGIQCSQAGTNYSVVDLALFVDNAISDRAGVRRVVAANTGGIGQTIENWSFGRTLMLPAGNHVFEIRASGVVDGGGVTANVSSGSAPQLQGRLTVTVLLL